MAPRTVESYLKGNSAPRYMRRLREIEHEFQAHQRRLEASHRELRETLGHDPAQFARRWRARARAWRFDRLNELIREHNEWYPIESNLPMDPRTRDFRTVRGRSYRRLELGPRWLLERYPPSPHAPPPPERYAPREPAAVASRGRRERLR